MLVDIVWLCFRRDNYGFVTFAHYDGACAAVERKFCCHYYNYMIGVLHATKVYLCLFFILFHTGASSPPIDNI